MQTKVKKLSILRKRLIESQRKWVPETIFYQRNLNFSINGAKDLLIYLSLHEIIHRFTGEVFMKEYEIKSEQLVSKYGENYDDLYDKCKK